MAGTVTRRCDNPVCRRPVMIADRDGTIGNAFGSVVVRNPTLLPVATCSQCHHETSWDHPPVTPRPASGWPLADAHARNLAVCAESGHDALDHSPAAPGVLVHRICRRCGGVYVEAQA